MNNWTIGQRLAVLTGQLIFNLFVIWAVNYWSSQKLAEEVRILSQSDIPAIFHSGKADMMHDGLRAVALRALNESDPSKRDEIKTELNEMMKLFKDSVEALKNAELSPTTREALLKAEPDIDMYIKDVAATVDLASANKREQALAQYDTVQKSFEKLEESLGAFSGLVEADSQEHIKIGHELVDLSSNLSLGVFLLGLILGLIGAFWSSRNISEAVRHIVSRLSSQTSEVNRSSESINEASSTLSTSTTRQASALQQTSSAIEEMSAMLKRSSDNVIRSRDTAVSSQEMTEKGKRVVEEMVKAIGQIQDSNNHIGSQIENSNTRISEIITVISDIGQKTKVINDIVFQTKLLSFNASVEAARAGEHGKGFAVVAEEVGNLAQMSGNAAKEISDMLSVSIQKVESIVNETKVQVGRLIDESREHVSHGTKVAQECDEILDEVLKNIVQVNRHMDEIASASKEQSVGISEVNKAVLEINATTQSSAQTSEKASQVASDLRSKANEMSNVVEELQRLSGGSHATMSRESRHGSGLGGRPEIKAFGDDEDNLDRSHQSAKKVRSIRS